MADFTTNIITRFEIEAENQNAALSEVSERLEKVGKTLEKSTDGFDKLRSAVDATGDRLRLFGKRGRALADSIEDHIEDPVERARLAMHHFRIQAARTQDGVDKFGQQLGRFRVGMAAADQQFSEFGLTFANIGIAIAAAGVALVAFAVDSVRQFIEANAEAKESTDNLAGAFRSFQEEIGGLVFEQTGAGSYFDGLATSLRGVAGVIRDINKLISEGAFKKALRLLTGLDRSKPTGGDGVNVIGGTETTTTTTSQGMTPAEAAAFGAKRDAESKKMEAAADAEFKAWEAEDKRRAAAGKAARGGGGRRKARNTSADPIDLARRTTLEEDQFARQEAGRQSGINAIGGASVTGVYGADMDAIKANTAAALAANTEKLSQFKNELESANAPTMDFFRQLSDGASMAHGNFVSLGSAIGGALGSLAAGTATMGDFGAAMLQVLGSIATQWGTFFLAEGLGFSFLPGGQGFSVGLTAAGIALTALGAGLSSVSSGSSPRSASRGASGTAAADVARDITRPRDDKPSETTIQVFVAGDQIRNPIWKVVDEGARLGRFRHLQGAT